MCLTSQLLRWTRGQGNQLTHPRPSHPVRPLPPSPHPHSPGRSSPEPQQAAEDYRGPDDQPGYLAVVQLATALVGLRYDQALSEGRVDELIGLYEALSTYDRARVLYPPRYRDRPARGRFMAAKSHRTSIPGVESMRRCLVGQTSGPASSPSTSRLVEAVCTQLCRLYPSGTRVHSVRRSRWDCILLRYQHIRDLVLGHQRLMARAPIQLYELNCRTLSLWYVHQDAAGEGEGCARCRRCSRGRTTSGSGLGSGSSDSGSSDSGSSDSGSSDSGSSDSGSSDSGGSAGPRSTAGGSSSGSSSNGGAYRPGDDGSGKGGGRSGSSTGCGSTGLLSWPYHQQLLLQLLQQDLFQLHSFSSWTSHCPSRPDCPYNTEWNRRNKAKERAQTGRVMSVRAGVPQVQKCRKCGQPKRRETGHSRYRSEHFCSAAAGKSVEDWLREMKERDPGRAPD
ncbi:hypothetical protein N1851_020175 [Merluccius polli]|uniref:Uncharacterized protein n=1 Tax=Merluccius polli TaxID=89951 RepID=A0AA47ML95_MERPO|nr:hypothetical protein N1851_020175 [Merluccius polli]